MLGVIAVAIPVYALSFRGGLDPRGIPAGSDFLAFWSAGRLAGDGDPAAAYDVHRLAVLQLQQFPGLSDPFAFVSPPSFLLAVLPLGALPYLPALAVWSVVGLTALWFAIRPLLAGRRAIVLLVAFPGLWLGLAQGQTQFFTAALAGAALLWLRPRPVLAGLLIGALALKPQLAVVFPVVLLAGRHWRALVAAAGAAIAVSAVGVVVLGRSTLDAWLNNLDLVRAGIDSGDLPVAKFVTPYTAARLLGLDQGVALAIHAAIAVVAIGVVWSVWRASVDPGLRGAAAIAATFLVTPYAADYDLAVLAFPIAWLALIGLRSGFRRGERTTLVVTWVLPILAAPIASVSHLQVTPLVCATWCWLLWRRARAVPEPADRTSVSGWAPVRPAG